MLCTSPVVNITLVDLLVDNKRKQGFDVRETRSNAVERPLHGDLVAPVLASRISSAFLNWPISSFIVRTPFRSSFHPAGNENVEPSRSRVFITMGTRAWPLRNERSQ